MCDCRQELEVMLTTHYKEQKEFAGRENLNATLTGYSFIVGEKIESKSFTEAVITSIQTFKNGNKKEVKTKSSMFHSFCPFCGVKYD
jgi:hypothetical protein